MLRLQAMLLLLLLLLLLCFAVLQTSEEHVRFGRACCTC